MSLYSFLRICCACLLATTLMACGNRVELMAAMPETEANEVLAALQNAGIAAEKIPGKDGMVGVTLDGAQVGRAVDLLRAKGLPRERFAGMGEVFRKEGLISSPLEERARYLYALSQELGATITQIDGVIVARVHVVLPERGSPGDPNTPSSAAVFIKHQPGYNLDTVQPQVRRLVTNSIPGLTADKVSIVLVSAQRSSESPAPAISDIRTEQPSPSALVLALTGVLLLTLMTLAWVAWRYWWPQRSAQKVATTDA
jgi:type III secretion protein J